MSKGYFDFEGNFVHKEHAYVLYKGVEVDDDGNIIRRIPADEDDDDVAEKSNN